MRQTATATHRIAESSGGCFHYAEITVIVWQSDNDSSVTLSPDVFSWLKDLYGANAWEWPACETYRAASISGANYAIKNINDKAMGYFRVEITRIHAVVVDTTWDSVAMATCFAVWKALDFKGENIPYWNGRRAHFPVGGMSL